MIEKEPDSFSDVVDRAVGELRSSPVPPELPPELLDALLQAAKENTGAAQCTAEGSAQAEIIPRTFSTHSLAKRKRIMCSSVSRIAAAAVFVFVIAGVALWFHVSGTPSALADFVKPILEAKSATFKVTFERNGKQVATANGMWLAPNRERRELQQPGQPVEITIADASKGVGVRIDSAKKTVVINKVTGLSRELASMNLFDEIRSLVLDAEKPDVQRESLGEKQVDGRRAVGWRLSGPGLHAPGMTLTIWGDPQTGLPIRIESYSALEGVKSTTHDFVFNVDLDESLFSIESPASYSVQTVQVDASQPTERDLITLLSEYGKLMNNAFPETLDIDRLRLTLGARTNIETMVLGNERPSDECLRELAEARTGEEIVKIIQAAWNERWRQTSSAKPDKEHEKADVATNAKDAMHEAEDVFMAKYRDVDRMMMRGMGFVVELPREADAHYAGKGVSLGAPGTPIFWYRPNDAKKYRVIHADLSVREADTPPDISKTQP